MGRRTITERPTAIVPDVQTVPLGLFYLLHGREDEAKCLFQVKQALDIQSDYNSDNDQQGFYELFTLPIAAGDHSNAIAVLDVLDGLGDGSDDEDEQDGNNERYGEVEKADGAIGDDNDEDDVNGTFRGYRIRLHLRRTLVSLFFSSYEFKHVQILSRDRILRGLYRAREGCEITAKGV